MSEVSAQAVDDFRCKACGKLLARAHGHSHLEIKCVRCGHFNVVFEHMPEQVIVTDKKGVILYVNDEVERITGYKSQELIGKTPSVWGGQMPSEIYEKMWRTLLEDKKGVMVNVKNKKKTGENYDALLRVTPVLDAREDIVFLVGIESIIE